MARFCLLVCWVLLTMACGAAAADKQLWPMVVLAILAGLCGAARDSRIEAAAKASKA